MTSTEEAILRTVIYADIFDFPLTRRELHHYLIAEAPVSLAEVEQTLASSSFLHAETSFGRAFDVQDEYVVCRDRQHLIPQREARADIQRRLWAEALRYGEWLARLPFVRMVALTGALAVHNASAGDDDLDYVLVTTAGRVWLARAFAIVLVRLAARRGVVVCPNYVLAESALVQDKQDLFMAHEVAQMVPLYGFACYDAMRAVNGWVADYLPNASAPFYAEAERTPGRGWRWLKRAAEALLGGRVGDALENWEYHRKLRRFAPDLKIPNSAALLDDQHVKGHFHDHGHPVMQQFRQRLSEYELEAAPLAGD